MADQVRRSLAHKQEKMVGRKRGPRVSDPSRTAGKLTPFKSNSSGSLCSSDARFGVNYSHPGLLSHRPSLLHVPLAPASSPRVHLLPSGISRKFYPGHGFSLSDELLAKKQAVKPLKAPLNPKSKGIINSKRSNSTQNSASLDLSQFESVLCIEKILISSPPPSSLPLPSFSVRTRQDYPISLTAVEVAADGGTAPSVT